MQTSLNLQRLQELEQQLKNRTIQKINKNDLRYIHLLSKEADKDIKSYLKKVVLNNNLYNLQNHSLEEMKIIVSLNININEHV